MIDAVSLEYAPRAIGRRGQQIRVTVLPPVRQLDRRNLPLTTSRMATRGRRRKLAGSTAFPSHQPSTKVRRSQSPSGIQLTDSCSSDQGYFCKENNVRGLNFGPGSFCFPSSMVAKVRADGTVPRRRCQTPIMD